VPRQDALLEEFRELLLLEQVDDLPRDVDVLVLIENRVL
jgi:hypothetical protein